MKTALILLVSLSGLAMAQDQKTEANPNEVKRIASVTWDLKTHKLVWTVQKGSEVNGEFVSSGSERYEISPDQALMAAQDEKRGFSEGEAVSLRHLLDVLSMYCAESVVWWEQGEGVPVKQDGKPADPAQPGKKPGMKDSKDGAPDSKPTRMDQPKPKPPQPKLLPGMLVAESGAH